MAKTNLKKKIARYATTQNIVIAIIVLISLILLGLLLFRSGSSGQETITKDQIRMDKNGEVITINKNGLVEYRTGETVTYKIWDSNKVNRFFDVVENKAREYLANPNESGSCVMVSLYLDGELVTICFSEDDEVVQEAYVEFEEDAGDSISLSDLFDDDEDSPDEETKVDDLSDYFSTTPTPTLGPTPTPDGSEGSNETQLPPPLPIEATCESWEEQIVGGRAIISNTLCSVSVADE